MPSVDRLVAPKLSTVDGVREVVNWAGCTNDAIGFAHLRQRTRGDAEARCELPCATSFQITIIGSLLC